jgi:hypothetical protein
LFLSFFLLGYHEHYTVEKTGVNVGVVAVLSEAGQRHSPRPYEPLLLLLLLLGARKGSISFRALLFVSARFLEFQFCDRLSSGAGAARFSLISVRDSEVHVKYCGSCVDSPRMYEV